MEEQEKRIEMEEAIKKAEQPAEPSYEDWKAAAIQWRQKALILENELKNLNVGSMRLKYLFKALEQKEAFSAEFICKCSKEIEECLTIDSETEE